MAATVLKRMQASDTDGEFPKKPMFLSGWDVLLWTTLLILGSLALAVVFWFPPLEYSFYPRCAFHDVTGLHCPGCGGFRAWHELLHGRWFNALRMNALAVILLPGVMIWLIFRRILVYDGGLWRRRMAPRIVVLLAVIVLAFGVLRNIPWGPFQWLAP